MCIPWTLTLQERPLSKPYDHIWLYVPVLTYPREAGYKHDPALPSLSRLWPKSWKRGYSYWRHALTLTDPYNCSK
jgi:hypothetical protein